MIRIDMHVRMYLLATKTLVVDYQGTPSKPPYKFLIYDPVHDN